MDTLIIFFVLGTILGSIIGTLTTCIIKRKKRFGTFYITNELMQQGYLEFNTELNYNKLKNKDLIITIERLDKNSNS